MNICATDYVELPTPFTVTCAAFQDVATWRELPVDATCTGNMWLWHDELYGVQFSVHVSSPDSVSPANGTQPLRLNWQIAPLAAAGPRMDVEVILYDAVISTQALVRVALQPTGRMPLWRRLRVVRRLQATIRVCADRLKTVLLDQAWQDRPGTGPVALEALPQAVAASVTTTVNDAPASPRPWREQHDRFAHQHAPAQPPAPRSLVDTLRERYPQTVTCFEAMGALDQLERIHFLEQGWQRILRGAFDADIHRVVPMADAPADIDYDLIYAGGGLALLHAVVMAQRYGLRVMLFDRGEVGCAHREWNISRDELQALVDIGVVSWDELAGVVMNEYRNGVVRFYDSPFSRVPPVELWLPTVLNLALDAGALLRLLRRKFEAAGGTVLDRHALRQVRVCADGPLRVEVDLEGLAPRADDLPALATYRARLLLDGMGSTSPLALKRYAGKPFASVCPTVGTVASGFMRGDAPDQFDPTIGDILVSVADAQHGRQLIWEGFPGRGDDLTVYLFYYATLDDPRCTRPGETFSLFELFEHYFTLLPGYKQPGPDFRHIKPVYGYIPGRHSLRPQEVPLLRGVLPIGDSAAQQSPLTFCGFGSHVRNLHRTTSLLSYALRHDLLDPQHLGYVTAFQSNISLSWVFSRFMHPWDRPHSVNELQNVFLGALKHLGEPLSTRFFRDQMHWHDYRRIARYVRYVYPAIFWIGWQVLGPVGAYRWAGDFVRFSATAACAAVVRLHGSRGEQVACRLATRLSPALGLRVRARYAEWRTMGWM